MFLLILTILFTNSASAKSTMTYTLGGLKITNVHELTQNILRGAEPLRHIEELIKLDVTDVLIFKNDTRGEVEKEIAQVVNGC